MVFAYGYTMAKAFNLEGLGLTYISIAATWTAVLLIGIIFLISRRNLPFLRIRNVPLAVSAVATLHVYWVLCMIAYILQGFFPCATEYWIMSIYLPLGIALFQACNTQLLYIADLQKRYATDDVRTEKSKDSKAADGWRKCLVYLHVENRVKRTMAYIAYGMLFQFMIAMIIYIISRKFHPNFGLVASGFSQTAQEGSEACNKLIQEYHTGTCDEGKKIACRRGWEWIPSIIWQFFWSWCYAPYLLWQLRDIRDVHGWRKQTTLCCLAGLFATPMWLCALYIPDMHVVNRYYVPPLWFAPSIFLIEAFLIFVPCWQVVKNHRLKSETLDIIAEWECKNNGSSIGAGTTQSSSRMSHKPSTLSTASSRRGEMYTMTALESAIRTNPQPLLLFAALKDFSGENISFLTKVLEWKRGWSPSSPARNGFLRRPSIHEINNKTLQRQQFRKAVDIYASYVSLKYSDYPINLSHAHLKDLEAIFESAAMVLYGHLGDDSDSATPFDRLWHTSSNEDIESLPGKDRISVTSSQQTRGNNSTDRIIQDADNGKRHTVLQTYEMANMSERLPDYVPMPRGFGPEVFDRAEESIKYMVLTNTWPKFVNAGYANIKKKTFLQEVHGRFFSKVQRS